MVTTNLSPYTCISITVSIYFIEIWVEKWEYECYQVVLRYLPDILDSPD